MAKVYLPLLWKYCNFHKTGIRFPQGELFSKSYSSTQYFEGMLTDKEYAYLNLYEELQSPFIYLYILNYLSSKYVFKVFKIQSTAFPFRNAALSVGIRQMYIANSWSRRWKSYLLHAQLFILVLTVMNTYETEKEQSCNSDKLRFLISENCT